MGGGSHKIMVINQKMKEVLQSVRMQSYVLTAELVGDKLYVCSVG